MNCFKHRTQTVPCMVCGLEEYERCKNENFALRMDGKPNKHDLSHLENMLKSKGIIN